MMAVIGITKLPVMSGPRHRNYREVELIRTVALLRMLSSVRYETAYGNC